MLSLTSFLKVLLWFSANDKQISRSYRYLLYQILIRSLSILELYIVILLETGLPLHSNKYPVTLDGLIINNLLLMNLLQMPVACSRTWIIPE